MIYTLGINHEGFEESSVEDIHNYFKSKEIVQFDTETLGMDPYTCSLKCIQLGDFHNQFVISPEYLQEFKELLETKVLLGQNLKFDLRFLYHNNIYPNKVWDTFLAEAILWCGINLHKKSLLALAKQYLNIDLDKSVREDIVNNLSLSSEEIVYSANDVKYLELIKLKQEEELTKKDLHKALYIENNFILVLAYIEYCGIKLDEVAWRKKMEKDQKMLEESKIKIDKFLIDNNLDDFVDKKGNKVPINWDSPKQVIELFKKLDIPIKIIKKGKELESVSAKSVGKYKKEIPFVEDYLNYKENQKLVGTYGQSFLDQINPVSGRLHTNFRQVLDTGRISSGGKDKINKVEYVNLQNIPADVETRSCFIAIEGNMLIDADFSGQEQVVLANKSLDPNLLKFYDEDLGDIHSFTASNMYPELSGMDLKEVKEKHKDKRQKAKSAGFAINYGGNETTIACNENIPIKDAKNIYDKYFEAFPGLRPYFNKVKQQALKDGFVVFNEITRRKSFVYNYEEYLKLKVELDNDFWNEWRILKGAETRRVKAVSDKEEVIPEVDPKYLEFKEKISSFYKIKGDIERKSLNFPIQGTSAEITKISAILMFKWIKENNYQKIVLFVNEIHDENLLEAPKDIAPLVAPKLEECMKQAGFIYCKRVPLKADAVIVDHWEH